MSKSLNKLLLEIEHYIDDPREGLTEEIFYFISKLLPLILHKIMIDINVQK